MDRCTKFKVFNLLLVFCVLNFFLYRIFSQPHSPKDINGENKVSFTGTRTVTNNRTISEVAPSTRSSNSSKHSVITMVVPVSNTSQISGNLNNVAAELPQCPLVPPNLMGPLATYITSPSFEEIAQLNPGLKPGGTYKPADCVSRYKVAIVIPYRNREEHLKMLLHNIHPMLMRQQLDYGIYVVDQALPGRFNRAMLMNIGFVEAMKRYDYQCAIFHDVDLIPENDRNIYSCPEMPRHLSAAIDKFKYRLPYAGIYGGVSGMTKEHFEKINGFSNQFFGWGGEDDDIATRIRVSGLKVTRYPMEIARYKMIKHKKDEGNEVNPKRHMILKSSQKRMPTDGLNSLQYKVEEVETAPTHLRIKVLIDEAAILKS